MMMLRRSLGIAVATSLLSGCGGGGAASPAPQPPPNVPASSKARIGISLRIPPRRLALALRRGPAFVSPNTNGVEVDVYATSDTAHTTLVGSSVTDVSASSTQCGAPVPDGSRTCSIVIPAPAGADDLVFTTYDSAPLSAAPYWIGGHVLGTGTAFNAQVSNGVQNSVSVTLDGVIAQIAAPVAESAVPGAPEQFPLNFNVLDASGADILTDAYATPVTATVTENAGSDGTTGHMTVTGDSGTFALTATLASPARYPAWNYDGNGSPGYYARITLTSGGVTSTSTIDPLYIVPAASSPYFVAGTSPAVTFTASGQAVTLSIAEHGYQFTAANVLDSCSGRGTATLSPLVSATPASSLTITSAGGSTPCSVVITDDKQLAITIKVS